MITCFIRYEIDQFRVDAFDEYARNWVQAIPRCGADLIGYFTPHEGSTTTAYGLYNIENLAAYELIARDCGMIPLVAAITSSPSGSVSSCVKIACFSAVRRHLMHHW
jgi:hypothetical protein